MQSFGIDKLVDAVIRWMNYEPEPDEMPSCDFERIRYELKPCDVVMVEGRSRVSDVIRMITYSPWTHAALYVGRLHDIDDPKVRALVSQHYGDTCDAQFVIESILGKGTIVNKLTDYEDVHIRICRPKGLSYKDSQEVIRYAASRLGAEYDIRQIFDLARFFFPWFILPRRFRSTLFHRHPGRPTRTVCSTMIAEAFSFIQFPILPLVKRTGRSGVQLFRRNPRLCVPRDFDYSPYFEIIKYPFIDFSVHSSYRLLPWKGSGVLSGEEADMYMSDYDPHYPLEADSPIPKPKMPLEESLEAPVVAEVTDKLKEKDAPDLTIEEVTSPPDKVTKRLSTKITKLRRDGIKRSSNDS